MSQDKSGMSLDEFAELDPEEVAAQCGGTTSAEDGPNPGVAGEQEAIVADEEHLTDPADAAPSEGSAERRGALRASDLLPLLQQADPSLDDASALELLQEILNEYRDADKLPRVIKSSSEFVPATLEPKVRAFVAANGTDDSGADDPAQPASDQGASDASVSDSDSDSGVDAVEASPAVEPSDIDPEAASDASTPPVDDEPQLDSYREALRPLLEAAVEARRSGTRDESDAAVWKLAEAIFDQGFTLYRELRQSDEEAEKRLFQLPREEGQDVPLSVTRDEIAADPDLREQVWYYRAAVRSTLRVFEGKETIQENLEDFTWPSEAHYRRLQNSDSRRHSRSAKRTVVPGLPPRPASEEPASSSTDDTPPSESVTGAANSGAPKEPEGGPPTQPVPVVRMSEGRRTVSSSDAPEPQRHVVQGGGRVAMRSAPKAPAAGRQSSDPAEEPDAQQPQADGPADGADRDASRRKRKSDESFLVELPDEVFEAAVKAVIGDPDPEQCWAFRSADAVRAEAERRILVESGRQSAA